MRCYSCGHRNPKGSRYCASCGRELRHAASAVKLSSLRLRAVMLTAAGLVLLFCLAAALLSLLKKNDPKYPLSVAELTIPPTETPEPTPTMQPLHINKPIRRPTPTPVPSPTPAPKPHVSAKPIIKTTPVPAPTEAWEGTAEPSFTPEYDEDCEPIDALCGFMLYGKAQYARRAFPPEYIAHTVASYGFALQLLGSEDAVIEYAGGMLTAGFTAKYGSITSIEPTLTGRKVLTAKELSALAEHLKDYGINSTPDASHLLTVELEIISSRGTFYETVYPHVLLIDGVWYIDPADIDF